MADVPDPAQLTPMGHVSLHGSPSLSFTGGEQVREASPFKVPRK